MKGLDQDLEQSEIENLNQNPLSDPYAILGIATTRLVYDLFAYYHKRNGVKVIFTTHDNTDSEEYSNLIAIMCDINTVAKLSNNGQSTINMK